MTSPEGRKKKIHLSLWDHRLWLVPRSLCCPGILRKSQNKFRQASKQRERDFPDSDILFILGVCFKGDVTPIDALESACFSFIFLFYGVWKCLKLNTMIAFIMIPYISVRVGFAVFCGFVHNYCTYCWRVFFYMKKVNSSDWVGCSWINQAKIIGFIKLSGVLSELWWLRLWRDELSNCRCLVTQMEQEQWRGVTMGCTWNDIP